MHINEWLTKIRYQ